MAKNFLKKGDRVTVVAGSDGAQSGKCYVVGAMFGIATTSAEAGEEYELDTSGGVYEYGKTTGQAWSQGAKLYYDNSTDTMTTTEGSNTYVGVVEMAAETDATIGRVRFNRSF